MRTLQLLTIALAFSALPVLADHYDIVGTVGVSTMDGTLPSEPTINAGNRWYGTLSTEGNCQVCYAGNGAQLEFILNIFGEYQSPMDADFLSGVTFTPATLALSFFNCERSPSVEISGNFFFLWWGPPPNPLTEFPYAEGGITISRISEPSTLPLVAMVGFAFLLVRISCLSRGRRLTLAPKAAGKKGK